MNIILIMQLPSCGLLYFPAGRKPTKAEAGMRKSSTHGNIVVNIVVLDRCMLQLAMRKSSTHQTVMTCTIMHTKL